MNLSNRHLRVLLPAALAALPLLLASAAQADVRDRSKTREITRTAPSGKQTNRITERARLGNSTTSSTTVTGPDGRTATRNSNGQYDEQTGTWTRHSESVGPNGRTAATDATVVRTDSGYVRDVTHTGPAGGTSTRHTEANYDPATRTATRSSTATGPDGKTVASNATTVRTEDGYQRDVTKTGPEGKTVTAHTDAVIDREAGTAQRTTTVTGPDGKTATREVNRTWTPRTKDAPAGESAE
jgi:hypothetical protein